MTRPTFFRAHSVRKLATIAIVLIAERGFAEQAARVMKYQLPMTKTAHFSPLGEKVNSECNVLYHLLLDHDTIMDPAKRAALLIKAKPLLLQYRTDLRQLAVQDGNSASMLKVADEIDAQTTERLALLGDEETTKSLAADIAGSDVNKAMKAQCVLINNQWTLADGNVAEQSKIVDAVDKLDHAHPDNNALAVLTLHLSDLSQSDLRNRLLDLVADVMKVDQSPRAQEIRRIRETAKETKDTVGRSFALTGTTVDGKPFSTADWKGKVVLVDFWATWCGPCKQELPAIKKLYADYHDKGLEIVSVSNDFSLDALKKFTADNQMPWPQLVDADAMAKRTWSSVTLGHGVDSLPRAFVIDKNGNLVDDHATHTYQDLVKKAIAQ